MTENRDAVIRQKTARLEAAKLKVQQFQENSGDLRSLDAVPVGMELIQAFSELAKEFSNEAGEQVAADTERLGSMQDFLKIFTFTKKKELEKYCRDLVIQQRDLVDFILACELGQAPFRHLIHYGDHQPEGAQLTDDDLAAISNNPVGLLHPGAQKAFRKISHLFNVRRYLVGHIFYTPDLSEWHFFQFDQRDLEDTRPNHWKEGAHIHFMNWLWPNRDPKILWNQFTSGEAKLNDSVHVRFNDSPQNRTIDRKIKNKPSE